MVLGLIWVKETGSGAKTKTRVWVQDSYHITIWVAKKGYGYICLGSGLVLGLCLTCTTPTGHVSTLAVLKQYMHKSYVRMHMLWQDMILKSEKNFVPSDQ